MKICCDKCEKAIKNNLFGNPIEAHKLIIRHEILSDETIYLCKECMRDLRKFLDEKGDAK